MTFTQGEYVHENEPLTPNSYATIHDSPNSPSNPNCPLPTPFPPVALLSYRVSLWCGVHVVCLARLLRSVVLPRTCGGGQAASCQCLCQQCCCCWLLLRHSNVQGALAGLQAAAETASSAATTHKDPVCVTCVGVVCVSRPTVRGTQT